jgi:hypothetical protein
MAVVKGGIMSGGPRSASLSRFGRNMAQDKDRNVIGSHPFPLSKVRTHGSVRKRLPIQVVVATHASKRSGGVS